MLLYYKPNFQEEFIIQRNYSKGEKVTSRKQAIAIGLSRARKKGAKVFEKKSQ